VYVCFSRSVVFCVLCYLTGEIKIFITISTDADLSLRGDESVDRTPLQSTCPRTCVLANDVTHCASSAAAASVAASFVITARYTGVQNVDADTRLSLGKLRIDL